MFLLYADESGTPGGSDQEHFILAGITVFERKAHWLSLELDKIASRFIILIKRIKKNKKQRFFKPRYFSIVNQCNINHNFIYPCCKLQQ